MKKNSIKPRVKKRFFQILKKNWNYDKIKNFDYKTWIENNLDYVDSNETVEYNLENLIEMFNLNFNVSVSIRKPTQKELREYEKHLEEEAREHYKEQERIELEQAIENIDVVLNRKITELKYMVKILNKSKEINGLILYGKSGIGKTYSTYYTLRDLGLKFGQDFVLKHGHITTLALYTLLYDNNGKTIIIDDVGDLWADENRRAILLCALWGIQKPNGEILRRIHYHTSKPIKVNGNKYENEFDFNGRIIIISNNMDIPENIETRIYKYKIDLCYDEVISLIKKIGKKEKIDSYVIDFILNNTEKTDTINIRLLKILNEVWVNCKKKKEVFDVLGLQQLEGFKNIELGLTHSIIKENLSIKEDSNIDLVIELMWETDKVKEAVEQFCKITGKSKQTFYNYRNMILVNMGIYERYFQFKKSKSQIPLNLKNDIQRGIVKKSKSQNSYTKLVKELMEKHNLDEQKAREIIKSCSQSHKSNREVVIKT